jgi:hypothetical protein
VCLNAQLQLVLPPMNESLAQAHDMLVFLPTPGDSLLLPCVVCHAFLGIRAL